MATGIPAAVAVTDDAWFAHFAREEGRRLVDEVNFWRPLAQSQAFRVVPVGGPVFFPGANGAGEAPAAAAGVV